MEAKDTVMTGEEMSQEIQRKAKKWSIVNPKFIEDIAHITANKQAEISFKVGKQEGIKSVVDWIEEHSYKGKTFNTLMIENDEWQAFLKEVKK